MEEKFIKLTKKEDSTDKGEIIPIFINLNHVAVFNENDEGWSEITFKGKLEKISVKESIDEIKEIINDEEHQKEVIREIRKMMKSNKKRIID